ncbi:hypothetical protein [Agriterribacter sp.]|uniref:hypothetical protein n=1 Tax=Agriterribacter sp. TaxID=2821509 RepID=UPI002BBBC7F4|nr:hypothetical protein [Agriterribacter sp.]HTN06357.1 hypothetical protein [Agriterribacter sp.]
MCHVLVKAVENTAVKGSGSAVHHFRRVTLLMCLFAFVLLSAGCGQSFSETDQVKDTSAIQLQEDVSVKQHTPAPIDTALYDQKNIALANGDSSGLWPVNAPYPLPGAIFPFKRVVSYYGNLYSKRMGILGELPPAEMLAKLKGEVDKWEAADTTTKVLPALHYIAVTAQESPGKGGKYRLRMPFHQVDSVLSMAEKIDAITFLDVQVGLSTLQEEIPQLEKYLIMPDVHLGVDPEFSMKGGQRPGTVIGTFNADDINYVTGYLADLVKKYNLPPKILVVHRFTQGMVTNYKQIKTRPEVQIIMDMDGWGLQARKINTYRQYIYKEPVHYTGFKIFYKNDFREPNSRTMTPEEVLQLKPRPIYIQYQ